MQDGVSAAVACESVDIVRQLVKASACGLGRARTTRARALGSLDVEVVLPEGAVFGHAVDVGAVVKDLAGKGVLKLGDRGNALAVGDLERDTTRGRRVVLFAVALARCNGGRRLRVAVGVDGPDIGRELAPVHDNGAALGRDSGCGGNESRDGRGELHGGCSSWFAIVAW